jgi:tetratricopeptide (TPR) repeat protein
VDSGAALLYYQALSLSQLGEAARAKTLFQSLLDASQAALAGSSQATGGGEGFFAKFGERQSPRIRAANAHYIAGLARSGLGQPEAARKEFAVALELNPYLLDARTRLSNKK